MPHPMRIDNKTMENLDTARITIPQQQSSKYDYSYEKETYATVFGIILFLAVGSLAFFPDDSYDTRNFVGFVLFITRIFVTIKVVKIASRQNRNKTGWGVLAFLLPAVALIIIGQLRKLRKDSPCADIPLQRDSSLHSE